MSIEILYTIISFLVTIIISLVVVYFKSANKREDKIVTSLDNLSKSLTLFKDSNVEAHHKIESRIVETENKLSSKINILDRRVIKVEAYQENPMCPVVTKKA